MLPLKKVLIRYIFISIADYLVHQIAVWLNDEDLNFSTDDEDDDDFDLDLDLNDPCLTLQNCEHSDILFLVT